MDLANGAISRLLIRTDANVASVDYSKSSHLSLDSKYSSGDGIFSNPKLTVMITASSLAYSRGYCSANVGVVSIDRSRIRIPQRAASESVSKSFPTSPRSG